MQVALTPLKATPSAGTAPADMLREAGTGKGPEGVVQPRTILGTPSPLLGAWIGLGALSGDLVKSFAKRRRGILPGQAWIPFDQIDWLLGALAFAAPVLRLSV